MINKGIAVIALRPVADLMLTYSKTTILGTAYHEQGTGGTPLDSPSDLSPFYIC